MDDFIRNPIDFEKSLRLWQEWGLARISLGTAKEQETVHPLCACSSPDFYWDESPSRPDQYDVEYCHKCGHYTYWQRSKDENYFPDWFQEQNTLTGETRFRSENENLLLTAEEYTDYANFCKNKMSNGFIRLMCQMISQNFDIVIAKKLIRRRFGRIPDICISQPDEQGHSLITGIIFNKGGERIYF